MPVYFKNDDGSVTVAPSWEDLTERRIREAQAAGAFDRLAGAGQPLDLTENPFEGDRALGHRLLKNADVPPAWIGRGQDLDREVAQLDHRLADAVRQLQAAFDRLARLDVGAAAQERVRLRERRALVLAELLAEVRRLNRDILSYNLSLPLPWLEKRQLVIEEQRARFDAVLPRGE